jgi:hypothetical protein
VHYDVGMSSVSQAKRYSRGFPLLVVVIILILVIGLTGGWYIYRRQHKGSTSTSTPTNLTGHVWIFTKGAFDAVIKDPIAASRLRHDTIYLIAGAPVAGYNIIPTIDFHDETQLARDISSRASYVKAVLYDNEDDSKTPKKQRINFAYYYKLAGQMAHQDGLQLVATPALNLTESLDPSADLGVGSPPATPAMLAAYLSDDIAYNTAKYSNVIDIQSQGLTQESGVLSNFVQQASAQAKSANPNVTVLAGLSTCAGFPTNGQQLASAAEATAPYVSGWWMNIPAASGDIPNCEANQTHVNYAIGAIYSLPSSWYSAQPSAPKANTGSNTCVRRCHRHATKR